MGDWAAFQEDFWKVMSTLGINHDNDENHERAAPIPPENDVKEQKMPAGDVINMSEREAEWAKQGVWDSRHPHPVPSYPVVLVL
jgi:hypothetical protein